MGVFFTNINLVHMSSFVTWNVVWLAHNTGCISILNMIVILPYDSTGKFVTQWVSSLTAAPVSCRCSAAHMVVNKVIIYMGGNLYFRCEIPKNHQMGP